MCYELWCAAVTDINVFPSAILNVCLLLRNLYNLIFTNWVEWLNWYMIWRSLIWWSSTFSKAFVFANLFRNCHFVMQIKCTLCSDWFGRFECGGISTISLYFWIYIKGLRVPKSLEISENGTEENIFTIAVACTSI